MFERLLRFSRRTGDAVFADCLHHIRTAVAVFDSNNRLKFYNPAFEQLWGLSGDRLHAETAATDLLDLLRSSGKLPEQLDFASWKHDLLQSWKKVSRRSHHLWHLPGGRSILVEFTRLPNDALLASFDDVTDQLQLTARVNAQRAAFQAAFDLLDSGIVIFGLDGRVVQSNATFARQWALPRHFLDSKPHLNAIASSCCARFGVSEIWRQLANTINTDTPNGEPIVQEIIRGDGHTYAASRTRLSDGTTVAVFDETTDFTKFEKARMESAARPA